MTKIRRLSIAIATTIVLLAQSYAVACPTCKDALAGDGNSSNLVNGFGWSIVFMMAMPFLILAGISAYFYYEIRKARKASTAVQPAYSTAAQATIS